MAAALESPHSLVPIPADPFDSNLDAQPLCDSLWNLQRLPEKDVSFPYRCRTTVVASRYSRHGLTENETGHPRGRYRVDCIADAFRPGGKLSHEEYWAARSDVWGALCEVVRRGSPGQPNVFVSSVVDCQVTRMAQQTQLHISGRRVSSTGDFLAAGIGTLASTVCNPLILRQLRRGPSEKGFGTKTALSLCVVLRTSDGFVRTSPQTEPLDFETSVLRPSR